MSIITAKATTSKPSIAYVHCKKCDGQLGSRVILTNYDYFHVECFKCAKCNGRLSPEQQFYQVADRIYCSKCITAAEKEPECYECKTPIKEGRCKRIANRLYHETCVKCDQCGFELFNEQYCQIGNDTICGCCKFVLGYEAEAYGSSAPLDDQPSRQPVDTPPNQLADISIDQSASQLGSSSKEKIEPAEQTVAVQPFLNESTGKSVDQLASQPGSSIQDEMIAPAAEQTGPTDNEMLPVIQSVSRSGVLIITGSFAKQSPSMAAQSPSTVNQSPEEPTRQPITDVSSDQVNPLYCYVCKQMFTSATCLKVLGRFCHHACAKCKKCSRKFTDDQCSPIDDEPYCLECFWILTAAKRKKGSSTD